MANYLQSADDDRTRGMMHDVVADAAHDGAPDLAESPRADNDDGHFFLFRHATDDVTRLAALGANTTGDLYGR